MLTRLKRWFSKNHSVSLLALVISIIALGSQIYFLPYQIKSYKLDKEYKNLDTTFKSADLIRNYSDQLIAGTNDGMGNAIENGTPILKENGGKFSTNQLDKYLGVINSIYDLYDKNLITYDDITDEFSDSIDRAYNNEEIKNYLKTIRKEDPTYFMGLDYLEEELHKDN